MKLKHGKKSGLKYFTIKDIRSWRPCYDPSKHLKEDFKGTALTILNNEDIPVKDRVWVVLRPEILSEKALRLFAVWCYRQTLEFIKNPDPRSVKAANVAEAYALGKATKEELRTAYDSASYNASASSAVAYYSASSSSAAFAAASYNASASAYSTTAASAAYSAFAVAFSAASVAKNSHKDKLIEMVLEEATNRLFKLKIQKVIK